MIYSNNTYDITADISTYTRRDFKQVFDTTLSKWYMLNNLNEYEEYGIYGDSLSGTYYTGKLVVVNDEEYEWDGTQWVDLGPYVEVVSSVYRDASHTGYITFPLTSSDVASFEATFKITQNLGAAFLIGIDADDSADWRIFSYSNLLYYDCGNGRWYASGYFNNQQHMRFDGNPMRIYNYDTLTYLYTNSYIRPIDKTMYFGRSDAYTPTSDYGYLYDLVFYSDNGETAIAHYIPYVQNGVAGLYDTMSNTFLAPTGVLGSESEQSIPKKYQTKSAPTITNVWPSKWYHNSTYMYKLMRNDAEQIIVAYMSDDKVRKGEVPPPYKTNAYIKFSDSTSYSNSPRFETNIYLKNTYTIEFKIKTPSSNGSQWRQIIGSYESGLNSNEFAVYTHTNNRYFGVNWWNYGASRLYNDSAFSMVANTEYIINIQVGTGETYINGILLTNKGGNNVNATLNKVLKICANDHTGDPGFNGQIYYVKITEGDNLIAYYEANNDNNIVGYLDKVSGTKIINVGGGTVTYGEEE